jgi:hypothetical protein
MLSLETKQSGGKLLPHSDLRAGGRGVFLEKVSRSRKRNRDILLGTWNVRSLYRAGSLMASARKLARYKLDLVGVQEVRWDKEGTVKEGDYNFFMGISTPGNFRLYLDSIYFRMNFHRYDYIKNKRLSVPYIIFSASDHYKEKTNDFRLSFVWLEDRATHRLAPH